jgi:excisionase family DNA binding protein
VKRKGLESTELLTLPEVAKILKVSLSTVRAWIREGRLRSVKVGHFRRVGPEDLTQFIHGGRQLAERYPPLSPDAPIFQIVGIADSGFKGVSLEHDRYLAEAIDKERRR